MTRYPDGGMRYGDTPRPRGSPDAPRPGLLKYGPRKIFCGKKGVCQKINNYSVYKHTSPDGKVYIGVTKQDPKDRWCGGFGYADNLYFLTDIMTFGWVNFQHDILYDGLSEESALEKEAELIKEYQACDPRFGYNVVPGSTRLASRGRNREPYISAGLEKYGAKQVRCVETGEIFPSLRAAAKSIDVDKTSLRKLMRNGQRCHGYHWEFVTTE